MTQVPPMPEWLPQLATTLARAMTLYRLGDMQAAAERIVEMIDGDPAKEYTAVCLLGRMVAAKSPCPGDHEGPCQYQVFVFDGESGKRKQWDDVARGDLFALGFIMAMLHLDSARAKELYIEAIEDGSFAEGFMSLLARAAETVQSSSKQTITWH
ncbi:MAG: hypothetical protein ACTHOG_12815 [Marmoricola sp.]